MDVGAVDVLLGVMASLSCALTWAFASTVLAGLLQTTTTTPAALGLFKAMIAAPLLLAIGLGLGLGWPRIGDHLGPLVVSAVLGMVIADGAYMAALRRLGAARGVFVVPLVPVMTGVMASVALSETLQLGVMIGGLLTLVGVVLAVRSERSADGQVLERKVDVATVVIVGAYVVSQSASNVVLKGVLTDTEPLHIVVVRLTMGAMMFLPLTIRQGGWGPLFERRNFIALVVAVLAGTAFGMWVGTIGTKRLPVAVATTLAATTPVWALVIARLRGEALAPRSLIGAALAIVGVALLASTL